MENKENFSPIVKLKRLNLQDLLLNGAKIIKDESVILQEVEGKRTRPKVAKRYFVESENSDSSEKSSDEDYETDEDEHKLRKKASKHKRYFVASENSDSSEESSDEDYEPDEEEHETKSKASKHKPMKLTEYEKLVQKNKEEKMAFLKSLKIDEVKESFAEAVEGLKPKRKKYTKKTVIPITPRKIQKRSAKVKIDLSEEALAKKALMEPVVEKITKKSLPQVLSFKDAFERKDLYEDFSKDFNNLEEHSTEPFKDYESYFQRMQLVKNEVKASFRNSAVSCLSFHPMQEKLIIASSSSRYGNIGLWNVNSNSYAYVFETHTEGVTHLKFNHDQPNILVSSSRDGTVRCGDLLKQVFNEVYNVSEETGCTYFDFVSSKTFLVGQKNGIISVVDIRRNGKTSCETHNCHDFLIKSISVHPLDKNYFISAGNDGLIRLWDLRQLKKNPVFEFYNLNKKVRCAFFSSLTGKYILTSTKDTIGLYSSKNLTETIYLIRSLVKDTTSGKELSHTYKATWLPNRDDVFISGSRYHQGTINIYNDKMRKIFSYDKLGDNIAFHHIFHPSLPVVAGVNITKIKISVLADGSACRK